MHTAAYYRDRAVHFRELAKGCDEYLAELMEALARDYDALAQGMEDRAEE